MHTEVGMKCKLGKSAIAFISLKTADFIWLPSPESLS